MRFLLLAAVLATACSTDAKEPVAMPEAVRTATLAVTTVDMIEGAPASHVAVGGKLRVRVPGGDVTWTSASGPFAILPAGLDTFEIKATGTGTGQVEIETTTSYARIAVSAAPIASVGLAFDATSERHATVTLRDASGKRLVDASLRIASGSAPVTFQRETWDRIEFETLPPGDVFVKTDLLGATHAVPQQVTTACSLARR